MFWRCYEKPYKAAEPVIGLDEKPVSLHDDVRPCRPARPGHIAKRDNEYNRCGTANIFAVGEPKAGRHFNCAAPNRSAAQFAQVVQRLVAAYPFARKIHLVMDNLNIHCRKSLTDHLGNKQGRYTWSRLKVYYTQTRQLAQPSRDRTQPRISAMLGNPPHSHPGSIGDQCHFLERQGQPRSDSHSVEVHPQGSSREVRLPKEYF
jgi:DDE superfamily endonuclease